MSLYGNFGQEFKCKTSAYQRQQFGIKPRVRLTKDNYNVMKIKPITFEKSGEKIENVKKIFIHQANEKMDEAICERFYKLCDYPMPKNVMPMSIHKLGNSSVATVPTIFDLVINGQIKDQEVHKGDLILFASVGAGMNINAIAYRY